MKQWALQDAKVKLSEVVKNAQVDGPQYISVRGDIAAFLLSKKDFQRKSSLADFFRKSPLVGLDLDFSRDKS
jgi:prevent-host-death family protein